MGAVKVAQDVGEAARAAGVSSTKGGGIGQRVVNDVKDAEKGVKAGRSARERLGKLAK